MSHREVVATPALRIRIGRYRLLGPIGHGGMADVFLALADAPTGVQKLAVVKVLRAGHRHDKELITMFMDEARIAARLAHPNVVQTYEVDVDAGLPYIAMEFLDGQPMHHVQRVLENGIPLRVTMRILVELLAGLSYAHDLTDTDGTALEIVHRDVSPQNVFITYDGYVKLMDFGIAKAMDSVAETAVGVLKGKLAYMAPEQVNRVRVDRRADLFSVGVLLWEGIAGHRMWKDVAEIEIAKRLDAGKLPDLPNGEEVSDALVDACRRALQIEPEDRWETAQAFRQALLDTPEANDMLSSEAVGELLRESFESERRQVTQLIEEGKRALGLSPSGAFAPAGIAASNPAEETRLVTPPPRRGAQEVADRIRHLSPEPSGPSSQVGADEPTRVDGHSDAIPAVPVPPREAEPEKRRWTTPVGVGLLVAGVGIGAFFAGRQPATEQVADPGSVTPPRPSSNRAASEPGPTHRCADEDAPLVELSGDIEGQAELGCDKRYLLRFNTFVRPGSTLTIEPGTVIVGDQETKATLIVQPGGRLVAEGTPERPIVFTSERPKDERAPGDWGGVILLGRAPINLADREGRSILGSVEGLTRGGAYGGDDPDDDSGVLAYVRIEYGGIAIAPNNEINGLTLGGVGRGTRISHVEVRESADDCFEFFGGTVNADHLICDGPGDDGIDWDFGFTGTLRTVVVRSPNGEHGIEGDNDPNGSQQEPISAPTLSNVTLCGATDGRERYGMLLRRSTQAKIFGLLTSGWDAAVDIRDDHTGAEVLGSRFGPAKVHPVAIAEQDDVRDGPEANDDNGLDERAQLLAAPTGNASGEFLPSCMGATEALVPKATLTVEVPSDVEADPWAGAFENASDRWDQPWAAW